MTKVIQGFVMVDAWASALNNAGTQSSERTDNIVRTKIFWREREAYPYVSGQSWRYWWRMTLAERMGWSLSPIYREKKIAYTAADPLTYPDDDIFGYMRAPKSKKDASGAKSSTQTVTRLSVLKNSPLISIGAHRPTADFGTFSRLADNPVPYEHEFYSTVMKGMFSIDVDSAGVFKQVATAGSQNLPDNFEIPKEFKDKCTEVDGKYFLDKDIRLQRIKDVLEVIPHLSGGAMSARHLTRVAPSLIVLGAFNTGSHLFSHLGTQINGLARLHVDALRQVLDDYEDDQLTKVYVGRQAGFLDEQQEDLATLAKDYGSKVEVTSVLKAVKGLIEELPKLLE
ncbi:MAG: type I-B CRISPR-associated protein Cas7/Cst2/DevR [Candidatus Thorarchaeota archaeon]